MGRWSQTAYEDALLTKIKTLFQTTSEHLFRDQQVIKHHLYKYPMISHI
jgi:hypothetical protein